MTLALLLLTTKPRFANGLELIRAVDRKIGGVNSLRATSEDITGGKRSSNTIEMLTGGYAKSEDPDEIDFQNPGGGWIVHRADKTYEHLKKGEMVISPFIWKRWGDPKDLEYGKVTEVGGVYRTSIKNRRDDSRLALDFDRKTLLPKAVRIFVGHSPELEKTSLVYRRFELNVPLTKADFEYRISDSAHEVVAGLSQEILKPGTTAPEFRMQFISGAQRTLAQCLEGQKALLLTFWFYGCGPCRAELPTLIQLHKEFAAKGLKIVSVDGVDPANIVRTYYRDRAVPFDAAVGITDAKALEAYKFGPCPMTLLVDPTGKIVYSAVGFDSTKTYETLVAELEKLGIKQDDNNP